MSLKELVVCKFDGCNQVYTDPRILPCGKRTCVAHIEEMMMKQDDTGSDRKLKCHFCHKIHMICSGEELPADENIPLLLNTKHCKEHEAAKKSFNALTQLLAKLDKLDAEAYAIDVFEQLEVEIELEKDVNLQKLIAHYQKLLEEVHKRRANCMSYLLQSKTRLDSELAPIDQKLKEFELKLKRDNLDFILKTLDGDQAKWTQIQIECDAMLAKVKSLDEQLNGILLGDERIGFRPNSSSLPIEQRFGQLDHRLLDSLTVDSYKQENDLVRLCDLAGHKFTLVYRASRDGFDASSFHAKCDNQPRTLTLIRSVNGCIFGAFASVAWSSVISWKTDPDAFIFSLVNDTGVPHMFPIKFENRQSSIYCQPACGPAFGRGADLVISDRSNMTTESFSNLGKSYDFPLFEYGSMKAQSYLAGSRNFQTSEIEVFHVTDANVTTKQKNISH